MSLHCDDRFDQYAPPSPIAQVESAITIALRSARLFTAAAQSSQRVDPLLAAEWTPRLIALISDLRASITTGDDSAAPPAIATRSPIKSPASVASTPKRPAAADSDTTTLPTTSDRGGDSPSCAQIKRVRSSDSSAASSPSSSAPAILPATADPVRHSHPDAEIKWSFGTPVATHCSPAAASPHLQSPTRPEHHPSIVLHLNTPPVHSPAEQQCAPPPVASGGASSSAGAVILNTSDSPATALRAHTGPLSLLQQDYDRQGDSNNVVDLIMGVRQEEACSFCGDSVPPSNLLLFANPYSQAAQVGACIDCARFVFDPDATVNSKQQQQRQLAAATPEEAVFRRMLDSFGGGFGENTGSSY
jgi:hypothetical protein